MLDDFNKLCKDQQTKLEWQEQAIKDLQALQPLKKKQKSKTTTTELKEEI